MVKKLKIPPFDPRSLLDSPTVMIVGQRRSGKTTVLWNILYAIQDRFDVGLGMTRTVDTAQELRECVPPAFVYGNGFNEDKLNSMIEVFKQLLRSGKGRRGLVILDDCMAKKDFRGDIVRELMMNGRHHSIGLFNCVQYIMDITTDQRSNLDILILTSGVTPESLEKAYKMFFKGSLFNSYEDFVRVWQHCTENHSCLVLNNSSVTHDKKSRLMWFRGKRKELVPPFRLFRPIYWKLSEKFVKEDRGRPDLLKPMYTTGKGSAKMLSGGSGRKDRVEMVVKEDDEDIRWTGEALW